MAENNSITIGHTTQLSIVNYKGDRVLTFKMIDEVHARTDGTASNRFGENKKRFVEGKHYHMVSYAEGEALRDYGVEVPPRGLTLITKRGYLLLVKSFTDDLAWEVQEQLVDFYFEGTQDQSIPMDVRETIDNKQYHALVRGVRAACIGFHMTTSAEYELNNRLRFQLNVGNVRDIFADDYEKALAIIAQASSQSSAILDFRIELEKMILTEFFGKGIPFTSSLRKKYKSVFQRQLPKNPNWMDAFLKLEGTESNA